MTTPFNLLRACGYVGNADDTVGLEVVCNDQRNIYIRGAHIETVILDFVVVRGTRVQRFGDSGLEPKPKLHGVEVHDTTDEFTARDSRGSHVHRVEVGIRGKRRRIERVYLDDTGTLFLHTVVIAVLGTEQERFQILLVGELLREVKRELRIDDKHEIARTSRGVELNFLVLHVRFGVSLHCKHFMHERIEGRRIAEFLYVGVGIVLILFAVQNVVFHDILSRVILGLEHRKFAHDKSSSELFLSAINISAAS